MTLKTLYIRTTEGYEKTEGLRVLGRCKHINCRSLPQLESQGQHLQVEMPFCVDRLVLQRQMVCYRTKAPC